MKRKYLGLLLTALLIINAAVLCGCGIDTSTVAGSMTVNADKTAQAETSEETAEPVTDDSVNPHGEPQLTDKKYDSTEFLKPLNKWSGQPYCEINGNKPDFSEDEIWTSTQESLDPLDALGRCGTANSCIGLDGMPTEPRGNISEIHPTGWHTDSYDDVEGGKLYNRCHLIGHKLSGDDAIARNLITGTSYMNRQGMLPFEDEIYEYVKSTGNHVMYRVTPCFAGDNLVAHGVHMQAISVEDKGEGVSFNVFCYNVQPGIEIDYATGDNRPAETSQGTENAQSAEEQVPEHAQTQEPVPEEEAVNGAVSGETQTGSEEPKTASYVLNANTKRFHKPTCKSVDQMNAENRVYVEMTKDEIIAKGYKPCGNCHPDRD